MQLIFNQYLTARDPAIEEDLKLASATGFKGCELFFDTQAKLLSSGAGLASERDLLKELALPAVCAGTLRWLPEHAGSEEEIFWENDKLSLLGTLFKAFRVPLCAVEIYCAHDENELALYPVAATKEKLAQALSSYTREFTYIGFGLCPDSNPLCLINSPKAAFEIIKDCANAKLSLILDAGMLAQEHLDEIRSLPKRAVSLVRLGADPDFNLEFMREVGKTGYDGNVSLSSTLTGSGDHEENLKEAFSLMSSALN